MSRRVSRGLSLTDKGRAAIGVAGPTVDVPLLTDAALAARFRPPRPGSLWGSLASSLSAPGRGSSLRRDSRGTTLVSIAREPSTTEERTRHE